MLMLYYITPLLINYSYLVKFSSSLTGGNVAEIL